MPSVKILHRFGESEFIELKDAKRETILSFVTRDNTSSLSRLVDHLVLRLLSPSYPKLLRHRDMLLDLLSLDLVSRLSRICFQHVSEYFSSLHQAE